MRHPCVTAVVVLALAAPAVAEEIKRMDPVVVTATKIETPQERLGAVVTVVTGEQIERYQPESVPDVLRRVPGVEVIQSGGFGKTSSLRIRGASPNQVQVLVDGVRVKSPASGTADLADIALDQIERIEIVRGPQSTIHGADAIGGVVNIITRRGRGPLSGFASVEAGNYDTHRERAGFSGSAGPFDYSLGGSWFESNGQFRNDGTEQRALSGQAGVALPGGGHLGLSGRSTLNTTELPLDGLTPQRTSPFFVLDPNARQESETLTLGLAWDQKPVEWFESHVRYGQFFNWLNFRDPATAADVAAGNVDAFVGDVESQIDVQRREVEVVTAWHAGKWNTLTAGGEHRYEAGENTSIVAGVRSRSWSDLDTLSSFLQDELRLFDRVILSGGWRHDDNSAFGTATTHRAALVVQVPETASRVRGAWAEGFRAPTINDLFFPDTTGGLCPPFGNRALRPERSESWEVGVDQEAWQRRVRARLTYFHNTFRDLITVVPVAPTAAGLAAGFDVCFQGGNVGRARSEGVEVSLELEPVEWLVLDANYTFTDTENETTGAQLPRFARHRWNARVTVSPTRRLSAFVQALVVSSRFEAEGFPRTPGYHRLDAGGRYRVVERRGPVPAVDVFARVNNLTDTLIMEPLGFRALGINAMVGLEVRY